MKYTNSFFGIPESDTRFNLAAAADTYEWVMDNPDISDIVISKMLLDYVPMDLERNKAKVDEAVSGFISQRIETAQKGLLRSISKGMTDEISDTVLAVDQIAKAYDSFDRGRIADSRTRNRGRFARESRQQIEARTRTQAATVMNNSWGAAPPVGTPEHTRYTAELNVLSHNLAQAAMADRPDRDDREGTPQFDTLAALTDRSNLGFNDYILGGQRKWNTLGPDDDRTTDQFWRRTSTAAGLGSAVAASTGNQQAATALMAGKWVGDIAPEAEKVIGPSARRATYRYRGTEKKPNPIYQRLISGSKVHYGDGDVAHEALLRGTFRNIPLNPSNPQAGTKEIWDESPLIDKMVELLPDPQRYHLNRKSGTIPPSQGIIIDKSGRVTSEAVGYGEDWYLPFNLKKMNDIRGGEYIRTRAFGGVTTEDIYAGLMSGARAVTVVSHSGVFTVEFDENFKGTRRYNDKAARMQKRYGQLLDAVRSREVSLGAIPPARMDEIKARAAKRYSPDLDMAAYKKYIIELQVKERENPILAKATEQEILTQLLSERVQDDGLAADFQSFQLETEAKATRAGNFAVMEQISTPESAVKYFGMEIQAKKAIDDAQALYEQEMNPLDLNGRGYYQALKGLQDQFPYYIKDVWHTDFHNGQQDYGYVKAKFNRPEGALSGYYDPTITGRGKVSADKTNYQNYPVMAGTPYGQVSPPEGNMGVRFKEKYGPKGPDGKPLTGALQGMTVGTAANGEGVNGGSPFVPGASPTPQSSSADRIESTLKMVEHLKGQRTFGASAGAGFANMGVSPSDWASLRNDYPNLIAESADDIRLRLYREGADSDYYTTLRKEVDSLLDMNFFVIDSDIKRQYSAGKSTQSRPVPMNSMEMVASYPLIDKGTTFDFEEVPQNKNKEFYDDVVDRYLGGAEGLNELGITPASTRAEIADAAVKRGNELADQNRIWSRKQAGLLVSTEPSISQEDIERESRYMAYILQAAVLREGAVLATPLEEQKFVEETPKYKPTVDTDRAKSTLAASGMIPKKKKVEELQKKLHALIGMDEAAKEIDSLINEAEVNEYLKAHDMPVTPPIRHLLFLGAPGTGKTTVAHIIAPIYHEMGLIPSDKVVIKSRDQLVQANQGNTEEAVKLAFEEAKGGVLFIDEAYSLKVDSMDTLGQIALNSINQKSSENQDDTVVILAGYKEPMMDLLKNNEGLKSRFPTSINFRNYNPAEMKQIAEKMISDDGYKIVKGSRASALVGQVTAKIANDPESANGRDVFNFYQKVVRAHKNRLVGTNPTKGELETITADDVYAGAALFDENMFNKRGQIV